MPIELIIVGAILLCFAAIAALALAPPLALLKAGVALGIGAAAIGVPLQIIYFAALRAVLNKSGVLPKGWYWRTFAHHHLLNKHQRKFVLPWFWAGFVAFVVVSLGLLIVLLGAFSAYRAK